jgi:hypothetical protein
LFFTPSYPAVEQNPMFLSEIESDLSRPRLIGEKDFCLLVIGGELFNIE